MINGVIIVCLSSTVWHYRLALASVAAVGNVALLFSPTHSENVTSRAVNGVETTHYEKYCNLRVERWHCDRALRNHSQMNDQFRDSRQELFKESLFKRHHMLQSPPCARKRSYTPPVKAEMQCYICHFTLITVQVHFFQFFFFLVQNIIIVLILVCMFGFASFKMTRESCVYRLD